MAGLPRELDLLHGAIGELREEARRTLVAVTAAVERLDTTTSGLDDVRARCARVEERVMVLEVQVREWKAAGSIVAGGGRWFAQIAATVVTAAATAGLLRYIAP